MLLLVPLSAARAQSNVPTENQTALLFNFVSNRAGFDTGIIISNTTEDSLV